MLVKLYVLRGADQHEPRVLASSAWWKNLSEYAGNFMRLCVRGIVGNFIDSRVRHLVTRFEFISNFCHNRLHLLFEPEFNQMQLFLAILCLRG